MSPQALLITDKTIPQGLITISPGRGKLLIPFPQN